MTLTFRDPSSMNNKIALVPDTKSEVRHFSSFVPAPARPMPGQGRLFFAELSQAVVCVPSQSEIR
jgi:hypothetical protein